MLFINYCFTTVDLKHCSQRYLSLGADCCDYTLRVRPETRVFHKLLGLCFVINLDKNPPFVRSTYFNNLTSHYLTLLFSNE